MGESHWVHARLEKRNNGPLDISQASACLATSQKAQEQTEYPHHPHLFPRAHTLPEKVPN